MDYIIIGLTLGATYALIAVGYTMVYGIMQLINFAHGEIYMFGAYFALAMIVKTDPNTALYISCIVFVIFEVTSYIFLTTRFSKIYSIFFGLILSSILSCISFFLFTIEVPFYLAFLLSMLFTSCLGITIEFIAYRPLRKAPRLAALITAIGMSLCLQNIARLIWSARTISYPDNLIPEIIKTPTQIQGQWITDAMLAKMPFRDLLIDAHRIQIIGNVYITSLQIAILLITILLMIILHLVIHRTRIGKAMRACAQDKAMASLMGIDVNKVITFTFALGSAMGAVAGILNALVYHKLCPTMGYYAGVVAFSAAVLGGIGNVPGAIIGGFILGIAQSIAVWAGVSQWTFGVAFAVLILTIILKPSGILGKAAAKRT